MGWEGQGSDEGNVISFWVLYGRGQGLASLGSQPGEHALPAHCGGELWRTSGHRTNTASFGLEPRGSLSQAPYFEARVCIFREGRK